MDRRTIVIIVVTALAVLLAVCLCLFFGALGGDRGGAPETPAVTPGVLTPAPGEPTPPPEPATPAPVPPEAVGVGDRVQAEGMALTVQRVFTVDEVNEFLTPDAGNTFLVVAVITENVDRDRGFYNELDFQVRDAEGHTYGGAVAAPDPRLGSGETVPGETVRGNVAFEVPLAAEGFVLLWQPDFFARPVRVNLGR